MALLSCLHRDPLFLRWELGPSLQDCDLGEGIHALGPIGVLGQAGELGMPAERLRNLV